MTLHNLLKQHLTDWPEGVTVIVQDPDGELRGQFKKQLGYTWMWGHKCVERKFELADDHESACVTRGEWDEANG